MSPFKWLKDLEKSGFFEEYEKRRFQAELDVVNDDNKKSFTVKLQWKDRNNQSGEIFIPIEGIKRIHSAILELEEKGFKEELGQQIFPP